jgi:hypothetical protein
MKVMSADKTKRKTISKKTRFDVFKRDFFKCQYCNASPPNVLLHIDHVRPVVDGGGNEIDNLVTACEPCNLGKGARLLASIPETLAEKAALVSERESQLLGYQAILESKRDRIEEELWRVADALEPQSSVKGMKRDWTASIRRFNERIGMHECLDAVEVARGRYPYGGKQTFLYFCGICWNKIRALENGNG